MEDKPPIVTLLAFTPKDKIAPLLAVLAKLISALLATAPLEMTNEPERLLPLLVPENAIVPVNAPVESTPLAPNSKMER
ncbi:MAG: hypothetical protein ACI4P3_01185, partial [Candidatus Spyradosoma sp.]